MSAESQNQSASMMADGRIRSELRIVRSAVILFFSRSNNSTASKL